jgi:ubiquinone/menaquinone biosynthesis C-methylase UbiE
MELIRLEVGSGGNPRDGYIHLDIDPKAKHLEIHSSTSTIPLKNNSVSELLSINMLEHIEWTQVKKTLKEWARVVAPGGIIKIHVPDLEWLIVFFNDNKGTWKKNVGAQPLNAAEDKWEYMNHYVMSTNNPYNMHRSVFTEKMLCNLLAEVGFKSFKRIQTEPRWLFIQGTKQ